MHQPIGRPLRALLREPTLVSDVNQTLSSMRGQVTSLKKTVDTLLGHASTTNKALAALATPPITTYGPQTQYTIGQTVMLSGNTYQCIKAIAGVPPPNVIYWLVSPQTQSPVLAPAFTYTSTTTTITFSWPANTAVYDSAGNVTLIGGGSQAVTGLTASTLYNFYPIYDKLLGVLRFISTSNITTPSLSGYTGNGTTGYVKTATSLSNPTSFSAEVWFQGTTSAYQPLLALASPQTAGSGSFAFTMVVDASGEIWVYLDLATGGKTFICGYAGGLLNGQLHHAVFTWNNSTHAGTLYIDGVSVNTYSGSSVIATLTGLYWHIGTCYGSYTTDGAAQLYTSNFLSNAAIYPSTLTAAQVLTNYSCGLNLSQTALAASVQSLSPSYYWQLQEQVGTTAADSAGSNTGTYMGGVTLGASEATHSAVGTPAVAWLQNTYLAAQAQILQTRVPLSVGSIQITTPSSGSGSGSGGGQGGGGHSFY